MLASWTFFCMTFIKEILDQHPDATNWHQQYPWFATGQLINTATKKDTSELETSAQHTAVFFNNIPRLHWLLHQEAIDKTDLLSLVETAEQPVTETAILIQPEADFVAPQFAIDLSGPPDEEEPKPENEPTEEKLPAGSLSQSLAQAAGSFKNEQPAEDNLLFETAYQHTIDYFASQGIKLEGEPAQDDRFGRQLNTFTSWLRQMKRLPNTPEQEADPLVETQAAHSLQKGEVLTESMADVLQKQGKRQQAIQVLEKLRLLHPEKSPYFAARIDQIKQLK